MKNLAFALLLATVPCTIQKALAQKISDYTLTIDKRNCDAANMHVDCSFRLDFQEADSVSMAFGGDESLSIENLTFGTGSGIAGRYVPAAKRVVFRRANRRRVSVSMSYDYTNLSAFFIYGAGNAELWETSFGEYYYPCMPNSSMELDIEVKTPDSLSLLCSYPLERTAPGCYSGRPGNVLAQSLILAFFRTEAYTHSVCDTSCGKVDIYQLTGMQCSPERYDELRALTQAAVDYFGHTYGEAYRSPQRKVPALPTFLFHDGKGFSNRYNIGFISASQEKFSTYPDIYPLAHEIGHRWLGEWTLLIDDGEPGAYFIKETLNEFMTLMFIRHHFGEEAYRTQLERCEREYRAIEGTPRDEPLIAMVHNDNNTVVYRKGPLLLDRLARQIGYGRLTETIAGFYREYCGKYPLAYADFAAWFERCIPGHGAMLNTLTTAK